MKRTVWFLFNLLLIFCLLIVETAFAAVAVQTNITPEEALKAFYAEIDTTAYNDVTEQIPSFGSLPARSIDPTNPNLVILGENAGNGTKNYILFENNVHVLRENNGYRMVQMTENYSYRNVSLGNAQFSQYRISFPAGVSVMNPNDTVCFVPADSGMPILMTVLTKDGNSITAVEGPPEPTTDVSFTQWVLKWLYDHIGDVDFQGKGRIQGKTLSFSYPKTIDLHMTLDADLFLRIQKNAMKQQLEIEYKFGYSLTHMGGSIDAKNISLKFDVISIPLLGIPEIGPCVTAGLKLGANGKGSFDSNLKDYQQQALTVITHDGKLQKDVQTKDSTFELISADGNLDLSASLSVGLPIKAVVFSFGPSMNPGFHFKIGVCGNEGGNPGLNKAADEKVETWHMCPAGRCLNGGISHVTAWSLSLNVGLYPFSLSLWSLNIPITQLGLWRYYHSFTYKDGDMILDPHFDFLGFNPQKSTTICPHMARRVDLKAVRAYDQEQVIPDTLIGLTEAPNYKGRNPNETSVKANSYFQTGTDGKAVLFLPEYTGTWVQASTSESSHRGVIGVNMENKRKSAVIPVEYDKLWLTFHKNTTRNVESMPRDQSGHLGDTFPTIGISGFPTTERMDFAGWSESPNTKWYDINSLYTLTQIKLNRDYDFHAIWKKYYQIEFRNYDNSLLGRYPKIAEDNPVHYSKDWPAPTKPSTPYFEYVFSGWDPPLEEKAKRSLSYQAQYREKPIKFFTVTWADDSGNILEIDPQMPYQSTPQYNGKTPTKPGNTYFCGWDPPISPVTRDVLYKARFSEVPLNYCVVTFEGDGGYLVPESQIVYQGGRAVFPAGEPQKDGYEFRCWMLLEKPYDFSQPVLNSMTLTAAWDPVSYEFTEGNGQVWSDAYQTGADFFVKRNLFDTKTFNLFEDVYVDGNMLNGHQYIRREGSLKLTLLADYLKTLSLGDHQIRILFADGEVEGTFQIVQGVYPITYDLAGGIMPPGKTNPDTYTSSDAFTLINPILSEHIFTGWTGTDLKERTELVSIPKGSSGSREYTAHWMLPTPTPGPEPTIVPMPVTGDSEGSGFWVLLTAISVTALILLSGFWKRKGVQEKD